MEQVDCVEQANAGFDLESYIHQDAGEDKEAYARALNAPWADALLALEADPFVRAKALAVLIGYAKCYAGRFGAAQIEGVEEEFSFPLVNPETGGLSRSFDVAGKIDLLLGEAGLHKVLEHKTTTDSLDASSDYWDRWIMDTQTSQYFISRKAKGIEPDTIVCDAIRRPMLQATWVPVLDENGLKIVLDNDSRRVRTKDGKRWKQSKTEPGEIIFQREMTPEEYFHKILADVESRPEYYFAQREVGRRDSEILEYMQDAWALSQEILYRRRYSLWPRNPQACSQLGGCDYFALCCGRAEVDGIQYRKPDATGVQTSGTGSGSAATAGSENGACPRICAVPRHRELSQSLQEATLREGKELLTASRMAGLRRCPRYHELKYEKGVEPVAKDDEARSFGTLIHLGLESFFKSRLGL